MKEHYPRTCSFYGLRTYAHHLGETWLEPEGIVYPSGASIRRAFVRIRQNPHNPVELKYGELRVVRCGLPDTSFSIPASLRVRGIPRVRGFVSVDEKAGEYTFTPNADPGACLDCETGEGCKE